MARIPEYAGTRALADITPPPAAPDAAADTRRQAIDTAWVSRVTAEARRDWQQGDPAGDRPETFADYAERTLAAAPSPEAGAMAEARLAALGAEVRGRAAADEDAAFPAARRRDFAMAVSALQAAVGGGLTVPQAAAQADGDLAAAASTWMAPEEAARWHGELPGLLAEASLRGRLERGDVDGVHGALADDTPESLSRALPPERRRYLMAEAGRRGREVKAAARSALEARLSSELAALAAGTTVDAPVERNEVLAALGDRKGSAAWAMVEDRRLLAEAVATVAGVPPDDQEATLRSVLRGRKISTAGSRPGRDTRDSLVARARAADRAVRADPAAYTLMHAPDVRQAFEAAGEDPDALAAALRLSARWQAEAGIPAARRQPLPAPLAADIVLRWQATEDPGARLDQLVTLTRGVGDVALGRAVLARLGEAGLPDGIDHVLDVAADPLRRAAALRLVGDLAEAPPRLDDGTRERLGRDTDTRFGREIGAALATSFLTSRDPGMLARIERGYRPLSHIAAVRYGAKARDTGPADGAYRDLYGHLRPLVEPGLVAGMVPADVDPRTAMRTLRRERDRLAGLTADPGGRIARGTWVNWGDAGTFALIPAADGDAAAGSTPRPLTLAGRVRTVAPGRDSGPDEELPGAAAQGGV